MSAAKTARWLDLIAYLLGHRYPVTREQIFENVGGYQGRSQNPESLRRMFERDKDELRELGIDIETVRLPDQEGDEPSAGYRLLGSSFYLPVLELHEGGSHRSMRSPALHRIAVSRKDIEILDRATLLVAQRVESPLAAAAVSARRKLEFDLPLPQAAVEQVLSAAPAPGSSGETLEVLQEAVGEHVAVKCRYYAIGRGTEELRVIEPYGLFFNWGRWYCVARARDRDALRVFRVDRMRDAEPVRTKEGRFDVPEDFSIQAYLDRAPWELSGRPAVTTRVRFSFPESRWVQAQGVGKVVDALLDDGGAVLDFDVQDENPFLRWLLTFRGQAEVLSPESTRAALRDMREKVRALYD